MIEPIVDQDDSRIAAFVGLRRDDVKDPTATTFVAEGRMCCHRLTTSPLQTVAILVQDGRQDEAATWVGDDVPIYHASKRLLESITGFPFHRGFLALGLRPSRQSIASLTPDTSGPTRRRVILAMVGVSQRENLGAMIRTATALGIDQLLMDRDTADPFSRRSIRTSMATLFKQRCYWFDDVQADLAELHGRGFRTAAMTLSDDSIPLASYQPDQRSVILLMGSEAEGLPANIQAMVTDRLTIAMQLDVDSLNVSVAAGIAMHSLTRPSFERSKSSPRIGAGLGR